jgi:glycosyltransferase involved in cell wall biosynthesis
VFPWTSWGTLGGTEKYILELAQNQSKSHEIYVLYPKGNELIKISKDSYTEIVLPDPNPKSNRLIGLGLIPTRVVIEWIRILLKEHINLIHFHCYEPYQLWYIIAAKLLRVKAVFTPHIVNFICSNGNLQVPNEIELCDGKLVLAKCNNCLLCVNQSKAKNPRIGNLINLRIKKIHIQIVSLLMDLIIPINQNFKSILKLNGFKEKKLSLIKPRVQLKYALDSSSKTLVKKNNLKVIFIGRLSTQKGVDVLANAARKLVNQNIIFHLYGSESDLSFNDLISGNLTFKGTFEFHEIKLILNQYDVLCLPSSSYEMMPLVVQEAIDCGLFIIGSNIPGIQEILDQNVNSILVQRNNVDELVNAFLSIKDGFSRNDHLKVESFDQISSKITTLYENLCN